MTSLALCGARIFDGEQFLDGHAVVVEGARIAVVVPEKALHGDIEICKLGGGLLAPGFIDVQVNGGGGALLNADPSVETVRRIARSHRRFGTTGLLPTVITDSPSVITAAIGAVKEAMATGVPGVLGIHVEGPFLDPARKGAHAAQFIRAMTEEDVAQLTSAGCAIMMVTVAPNKVRPNFIVKLAAHGVLVSLGHSDASCGEAICALRAGARGFTHLFNAMSQLTGREPGMVGAALSDGESFAGIIADGHHVHTAALQAALAAKTFDRTMLITDAMPSAAGGPDHFELQGRRVALNNGRLELADGTLAGCNLTMDQAVRHCVQALGTGLGEALRMASYVPAAFLRRDHQLGRIAPGFLANLVHLDDGLSVRATWINGSMEDSTS